MQTHSGSCSATDPEFRLSHDCHHHPASSLLAGLQLAVECCNHVEAVRMCKTIEWIMLWSTRYSLGMCHNSLLHTVYTPGTPDNHQTARHANTAKNNAHMHISHARDRQRCSHSCPTITGAMPITVSPPPTSICHSLTAECCLKL